MVTTTEKEHTMDESPVSPFSYGNPFGRKVIVALPVIVLVMIALAAFVALPERCYFTVSHGELCLVSGKIGWLYEQQSRAMDPVPVKDLDVQELTSKTFNNESDALAVMKAFFEKRVEEGQATVLPKEKELVNLYRVLLRDMKAAQVAGAQGLDKNIEVLQGWLAAFSKRAEVSVK